MHRTAFREIASFKLSCFNEMGIKVFKFNNYCAIFWQKGPRSRKISTETMEVGIKGVFFCISVSSVTVNMAVNLSN